MASTPATGPSGDRPGLSPFADDVALELGQGGEDMEDQLPAAGGRVDLFGQALETDSPLLQPSDGL